MGGLPTQEAAAYIAHQAEKASARPIEKMVSGPDGWSDWIHPLPRYRMQCCDCNLIHEMEFAIVPSNGGETEFNTGETSEAIVVFRARREEAE